MTYKQARKLHNGDEVTYKYTGEVLTVVEVKQSKLDVLAKNVYIRCHDGNLYHHRTLK